MEARLRLLSAVEPSKITFFSSNTILKTSIQSYSVLGAIIPSPHIPAPKKVPRPIPQKMTRCLVPAIRISFILVDI